jgi:hypothetical protein
VWDSAVTIAGERISAMKRSWMTVTRFLVSTLLFLVTEGLSQAQLTIVNSKHLDFPEDTARVLLVETSRVVANEFRVRNPSDVEYPLSLVLGEKEEGYGTDSEGKVTLFLQVWSESKFVDAAVRLAIQSLADHKRVQRLSKEVLLRSDRSLPVSSGSLSRHDGFRRPRGPIDPRADCISAVRDRPCPTRNIGQDNR